MKVSLTGMFSNIIRAMKRGEKDVAGYYEVCLDELRQHIEETVRGEHTLAEFCRTLLH